MDDRLMISIVDDDESVRDATASLMRSAGYKPKAFRGAHDFLTSGHVGETDFLIADVQMPGMSGIELHGSLVSSGKRIPTILITAYPDEKARSQALEAGVVNYLTKPFNECELLACIEAALERGDKRSNET
jgi:FixJ family two-component response regulator